MPQLLPLYVQLTPLSLTPPPFSISMLPQLLPSYVQATSTTQAEHPASSLVDGDFYNRWSAQVSLIVQNPCCFYMSFYRSFQEEELWDRLATYVQYVTEISLRIERDLGFCNDGVRLPELSLRLLLQPSRTSHLDHSWPHQLSFHGNSHALKVTILPHAGHRFRHRVG